MKNIFNFLLRLFFIFGVVILVFPAVFLWLDISFVRYTPYELEESSEKLSNPYIGWYTMYGYLLSEDASFNLPLAANDIVMPSDCILPYSDEHDLSKLYPDMTLLQINLNNYANCDLSSLALTQLDNIFSAWSETFSSLIVRFVYDWDGHGMTTEPESINQVLSHMEQIAPVINKYASSIYILQGIFVGSWGEMHGSAHMADGGMEVLINKLSQITDPSIFLSVRTPAQLRTITKSKKPLDASSAFDGTLFSRLGLFNDGMLGSANDTGTYGEAAASSSDYFSAWIRDDELAFQNELCRFVPNGGEVIIDNEYNNLANAISDLSRMHVSYLNSAYDASVLDKWKKDIFTSDASDIFYGQSGYDYIGNHLGYRFVIRSSSCDFIPFISESASFSVIIENVGFANALRTFDINIHAISENGQIYTVSTEADTRFWDSITSNKISASLDLGLLSDSSYDIYISCFDEALNRPIFFANETDECIWLYDANGSTKLCYRLGKIELSPTE